MVDNELGGLEFLVSIPGTLGGAIKMNAGAYGSEMSHIAVETEYVTADGIIKTVSGNDHNFSYRHSCFSDTDIIVQTVLKLSDGNYSDIKNKMDEYTSKRVSSQPLDMPSAGSVFKRPEGFFAGKLIEDSGLKGFSIGGAQVSVKHAGFIVNTGNATCEDVCNLVKHIQNVVLENTGVQLECEIKKI
jgi:UDP-N-acetylmuramate dehydrogenase